MNFLKRILALLCLLPSLTFASGCDNLLPYGYPTHITGSFTTQLCRQAYVVDYDVGLKDPLYSAEHLTGASLTGTEPRLPFEVDASLPANQRATPADYVHSGYDKGHMSPAGDFHINQVEMQESFLLTNMVPQAPANNRVVWREIEDFTRHEAQARGDVYVITGPVFDFSNIKYIGTDKVAVPAYTYKIVIDAHTNEGIAFIVPNTNAAVKGHKPKEFVHPIKDVETAVHRNFTPSLPITKAQQLKNVVAPSFLRDLQ